jgi:hypothetical protein
LRRPSLLEQTSGAPDTCSSLANQPGNINFHIPSQCNKVSDDLSRNVPVNLKQKIIVGEYIDFTRTPYGAKPNTMNVFKKVLKFERMCGTVNACKGQKRIGPSFYIYNLSLLLFWSQ